MLALNPLSKPNFPTMMPLAWAKENMKFDAINVYLKEDGYFALPLWSAVEADQLWLTMKMNILASSPDDCQTVLDDSRLSSPTSRNSRASRLTATDAESLVLAGAVLTQKAVSRRDRHDTVMGSLTLDHSNALEKVNRYKTKRVAKEIDALKQQVAELQQLVLLNEAEINYLKLIDAENKEIILHGISPSNLMNPLWHRKNTIQSE
jgi:hypothetical protein